MLTDKQLSEIKEYLEKAQNPLFFFDNDADGLCSFLLLRRYIGRGRGIAIKSFPGLDVGYVRKIHELNPDYIFILDKPIVSEGFLKEVEQLNLRIIWIDHHDVPRPDLTGMVGYYNSFLGEKPSSEPVTYWCYKITGKKEDLWLALAGCIGDGFIPDFSSEAVDRYPELWRKVNSAFEGLYETEIGKIARILNFALKDRTSSVIKMIRLMFAFSPQEVLQEDKRNFILQRFNQVNAKYQRLIEKARLFAKKDKLLYFQYGGDLSLSADIANELIYRYPEKIVVVVYIKGTKANISIRGKNIKEITMKAIQGIENAHGGGHKDAIGAQMSVEDLPKFEENLRKLI